PLHRGSRRRRRRKASPASGSPAAPKIRSSRSPRPAQSPTSSSSLVTMCASSSSPARTRPIPTSSTRRSLGSPARRRSSASAWGQLGGGLAEPVDLVELGARVLDGLLLERAGAFIERLLVLPFERLELRCEVLVEDVQERIAEPRRAGAISEALRQAEDRR